MGCSVGYGITIFLIITVAFIIDLVKHKDGL